MLIRPYLVEVGQPLRRDEIKEIDIFVNKRDQKKY